MVTFSNFNHHAPRRIAVLDSGVGGLDFVQRIREARANVAAITYLADDRHFPYGGRSALELTERLRHWMRVCEERRIADLFIACNSATVAWERSRLIEEFPTMRVHGILDAGARAAVWSGAEIVGVAATEFTVASQAYPEAILTYRTNRRQKVIQKALPDFASLIEAGDRGSKKLRSIIADTVKEMLCARAKALVLGCTHYPLVEQLWREALPNEVALINPAVEMANTMGIRAPGVLYSTPTLEFIASGDLALFMRKTSRVMHSLSWGRENGGGRAPQGIAC